MTVTSQNGWSANDRSVIGSFTVPGTRRLLAVRKGDVSVVLLDLAAWVHANIRPIDTGVLDDWGYAERTIRGSATDLSNHASGTAIDLDATLHPLAVHGTWTAEEKTRIHARLALYDGVVRWGEDYDDPAHGGVRGSRIDGMHFEINAGAAAVKQVADRIRSGQPAQEDDMPLTEADAELVAKHVWDHMVFNNWLGREEWARTVIGAGQDRVIRQNLTPIQGELDAMKAQLDRIAQQIAALAPTQKG